MPKIIKINVRLVLAILICILSVVVEGLSLYAETIWVVDKGAKQLLKVYSDARKKIIELNNFTNPAAIKINQDDGSVWITDLGETFNTQVLKLSSLGKELFRLKGYVRLGDSAIDYSDGSYFVVDRMIGEVIKISADGRELFRIRNLSPVKDLEGMGCLKDTAGCHDAYIGRDVNLEGIDEVGISPVDGSIWVADTGQKRLLKFDKKGRKITQKGNIGEPEHLDIAADGSVWVNNIERGRVFKISADARRILGKINGLDMPFQVRVSPLDGTCWVTTAAELVQISPDGRKILKRMDRFKYLEGMSAINPADGSFWVANVNAAEIVKISSQGEILKRIGGFDQPRFLDVYWNAHNEKEG